MYSLIIIPVVEVGSTFMNAQVVILKHNVAIELRGTITRSIILSPAEFFGYIDNIFYAVGDKQDSDLSVIDFI